jgi:hypothetical protein
LYTSRHQLGTCIKGSFVIVSMHFATKWLNNGIKRSDF